MKALSLEEATNLVLGAEQLLPQALWVWQDMLKCNNVLVSLSVKQRIGVDGCRFLSEGLRANETLQVLELHGCGVRHEGAKCLSNALRQNKSLLKLDLSGNCLRDKGTRILFEEGLEANTTLANLVLASNQITDASAKTVVSYLYGKTRAAPGNAGSSEANIAR